MPIPGLGPKLRRGGVKESGRALVLIVVDFIQGLESIFPNSLPLPKKTCLNEDINGPFLQKKTRSKKYTSEKKRLQKIPKSVYAIFPLRALVFF